MTVRILLSLAFGLALAGGRLAAQVPGDPDYDADPDTVEGYNRLGEEHGSDYELDEGTFDEAVDQAAANAPEVTLPGTAEVEAAHWEPDDDYARFGNLIESAQEERERWCQRVDRKLAQLAGR